MGPSDSPYECYKSEYLFDRKEVYTHVCPVPYAGDTFSKLTVKAEARMCTQGP